MAFRPKIKLNPKSLCFHKLLWQQHTPLSLVSPHSTLFSHSLFSPHLHPLFSTLLSSLFSLPFLPSPHFSLFLLPTISFLYLCRFCSSQTAGSKEPLCGWALGQFFPFSWLIQDDLNKKYTHRPRVFRGCPSLPFWVKNTLSDLSAFGWDRTSGQFGHICPQTQPLWPLALLPREDASLQG